MGVSDLQDLETGWRLSGEPKVTIAAENVGMLMVCAGHYQTETFGVKAVAKAMARQLKVKTVFIPREEAGKCKREIFPRQLRFAAKGATE